MTMHGDDLHVTAEKFLREYLSKTGSKPEPVQSIFGHPRSSPTSPRVGSPSQVSATEVADRVGPDMV